MDQEEEKEIGSQKGSGEDGDSSKREIPATQSCDEEDSNTSDSDSDNRDDGDDSESESDASSIESSSPYVSCIQETQLSPDGTCIFTTDYSRAFSTYVIDEDILEEPGTRQLKPYSRFTSADPIRAFAVNPYFSLSDMQSATVLLSRRDQYITLHNVLWDYSNNGESKHDASSSKPIDASTKLANYKLIYHSTEAVIAPLSLTFTRDATHFLAGHKNAISIFDVNYQDKPISEIKTIPTRKLKAGGHGYKGEVTALSISSATGMLAAGTRTRHVALYGAEGLGECITNFALPRNLDTTAEPWKRMGTGVTELKWSPCGKYLYIAERMSDSIFVYDVRNFAVGLRYCVGRGAMTNQKLGLDVWSSGDGSHEVWAGSMNGTVAVWKNPHLGHGALQPDEVLSVGNAPVAGTLVHPTGSIAVSAMGCVKPGGDEEPVEGKARGGNGWLPKYNDWGRLDLLALCS
ncbi:hypothetical protein BU24DRAFT_418303 [Aaosphaeria arxii CBS 175.79]|uniref:WD40 repeat-like protein n=1 Tax=Aaosphaeria arxii CBS 175.79 TaxID=1450172 RepID=A0A6A5Y0N1_9PLEO|nr:uncharacterized protein BU24DRAFT_418303 [Aaosphaeria arxii CBS 175.79]KAF2018753.1 hypothetical protein BU24DRAFT_418303 [Aaosphaeria arxii CBS 175.79]